MGASPSSRDTSYSNASPSSGIHTYEEAIAYFNEPRWRDMSLGLNRIRALMELLGNPQDAYKTVHVAGTNGKGSVCSNLESILRSSGLRCGLFTSPYIERFEERIQVGGSPISADDLIGTANHVRECADIVEIQTGEHPTEFELMCAAALLHFAEARCDIAVCEVGLGGRLDATNVIVPALSVITRIGLDHTAVLGGCLSQVASEKAGIIKRGVPVVSWPQDQEAMEAIEETSSRNASQLHIADFSELRIGGIGKGGPIRTFDYRGVTYDTTMIADYQVRNTALAIEAAALLAQARIAPITQDSIRAGVRKAKWPGRFEILGNAPTFIVDGAHNPQGAAALRDALEEIGFARRHVSFICGMLSDKDCEGALRQVLPIAKEFRAYTPNNPRAISSKDLCTIAQGITDALGLDVTIEDCGAAKDAVLATLEEKSPEDVICAFGTLYSIADVRRSYLSSTSFGEMTPRPPLLRL